MSSLRFLELGRSYENPEANKKADVAECPKAFDHVGLLVNGPTGSTGLPFN